MTVASSAQQRREFWWTGTAGILLLGVALVLLNAVANRFFLRLDLTQGHVYSLSPSSRKLVRALDDRLVVKAYFSANLPDPYASYERYVRDMLVEYRAASKGRLQFEFVPAYPPKDFEQRAQEAGLYPLQIEEVGSDQLAIRRGFMGLVLFYRDKSETIPVVKDLQQFEYDMTSRIAKMAARQKKRIAFTVDHGEPAWLGPESRVAQGLESLYDFKPTTLTAGATVPLEADGLLVVGPTRKLDDKMLWTIDQAIMRGIPTAFCVDVKSVAANRFYVSALDTGLPDFLAHYGVQLGRQLVYDERCETIGLSQNLGGFSFVSQVQYPFIPLLGPFKSPHPLLFGVQAMAMPFAVTVDAAEHLPADVHYTPLFQSSVRSWLASPELFTVSPTEPLHPKADDPHGPFELGAVIEGQFSSYFTGKTSPYPQATAIAKSPRTSILVIGTSHFVDPSLPMFRGAAAFAANVFAWLAQDETLLGIRSKGDIFRPLQPTTERTRRATKLFVLLGVPVLAALLGLARWRGRQLWRRALTVAVPASGESR